jgi:hypothetical protein
MMVIYKRTFRTFREDNFVREGKRTTHEDYSEYVCDGKT